MGQKVSPHGLRLGIIKDWDSKWCAKEDHEILDSHERKVKTKGRRRNFYSTKYSTKVSRFTAEIMRKVRRRLILP